MYVNVFSSAVPSIFVMGCGDIGTGSIFGCPDIFARRHCGFWVVTTERVPHKPLESIHILVYIAKRIALLLLYFSIISELVRLHTCRLTMYLVAPISTTTRRIRDGSHITILHVVDTSLPQCVSLCSFQNIVAHVSIL